MAYCLVGDFMENQIEKNIDYLRKSRLFQGFADNEIERFLYSTEFKIVELNRGEKLEIELDKSIFVLNGSIATYENNIDGVKTFINYFEPEGNVLIAVSPDTIYPTVSVEARKKSVVLLLKTNSYLETNASILVLQNRIQQNIISMFYKMTENVMQRTIATAESISKKKIIKYLKQLKTEQNSDILKIPFTRQELADHLQMDISTLMRELKNLQEANVLTYEGKYITILNSTV